MRVRTVPWNRVEFFAWLDQEIATRPDLKHIGHVAELSGISHTTLSNWRSGKQRPTTSRLALLAPVLRVEPRQLYTLAGIIEGLNGDVGASVAPLAPADWYEDVVNQSRLPQHAKDQLIERRRAELAQERQRLADEIKLMESLQSE